MFAAVTTLGLAAGKPSQAQQAQTRTSPLDMPDATHGKQGITHKSLLRTELDGVSGQEVMVWETEYAPRAINPRHYHPAAITFRVISGTFRVISGTGIWLEDGKTPVTLKAGDSLFVPAGTTHTHWNPSFTEKLRFLEFIVGEKGKAQAEPRAPSN